MPTVDDDDGDTARDPRKKAKISDPEKYCIREATPVLCISASVCPWR